MADAGSVELTKNPDARISPLKKIAANPELKGVSGEIAQMCIEDANDDSVTWFSTHPSDRIRALVMMGGHDTLGRRDEHAPTWAIAGSRLGNRKAPSPFETAMGPVRWAGSCV